MVKHFSNRENTHFLSKGFWRYLYETLFQFMTLLGKIPVFIIIQRSLSVVLPLIMVGAFGLSIRHFPFSPFVVFLDNHFGKQWQFFLDNIISGSLGIVSLAVLCTFSGTMTMIANQKRKGPFISPIMSIAVVLSCFFIICTPAANGSWEVLFSMGRGLLPTLCIAAAGCTLFLRLSRVQVLHWSLGAVGHDPIVRDILTVLPAGMVTIITFALFRTILDLLGIPDLHYTIRNLLFYPFSNAGDNLGFGLSYTGLSQLLWIFGAHGPNLLFAVEDNLLIPAIHANQIAVLQGMEPGLIFTKSFFDLYTRMGGSGSTICLIAAMLIKSRDRGARKLCQFAIIPALCNVNEPLLFGIPLVLNPVYTIPFLLTPLLQTITAYSATLLGLIPYTTEAMNWTTPLFISGFVSTGNISGPALQAVNLLIGVACYIPFVTLADDLRERQGESILAKLRNFASNNDLKSKGLRILDLPGEEGRFAKALAGDLKSALAMEEQIYLAYQPQVSDCGRFISGVEALLRWRHPVYGEISPPITISLAEELGIMNQLGILVLSRACRQRAAWKEMATESFSMSVNVAPGQLADPSFPRKVLKILDENHLSPAILELEITESAALEPDENTLKALEYLHGRGIRIAIDDFGMGHSSLRYLRSFPVSKIKIDRSLTFGDERQVNNQIVKSVFELCRTLNIATIVEGVETREQLDRFKSIGYMDFQGYYFSRPLTGKDCTDFIRNYKRHT